MKDGDGINNQGIGNSFGVGGQLLKEVSEFNNWVEFWISKTTTRQNYMTTYQSKGSAGEALKKSWGWKEHM